MRFRRWVLLALLLFVTPAHAAVEAYLRVIVPRAAVRTGPGGTYRALYFAARGEVLRVVDRNDGYWFHVVMPDGRLGWLYGEQTTPYEVEITESKAARGWKKFKEALFSPSPLPNAHAGLAFSGGVLGGDGLFMFRPAVTLDAHFALEAHIGESIGSDGALLLYGLGANILLWPLGPIVPFVTVGAGGATSFPKVNGVTQKSSSLFALDAGGGLMILFRKRIILRADVRNYSLFTPNKVENRQEFSGGLAVFF